VQFRLLGPVEAHSGDRAVPLGALKQRHLVAALLFDGGHPATFETLIDRLWGDDPPADARGTLYGYVARLRRTLTGDARLDRWSGGYTFEVPADDVDLYRFRSLVETARTATDDERRAAVLDEAVRLWRGEALAGLPGEWAARAREGLAQHRITALAGWAGAATALGRHAVVIDTLSASLAQEPLCEPLLAALMHALHAAGRTPEALDRYARARERIADELGADPGRQLREAHAAILKAPVATPRKQPFLLPPDLPDYTANPANVQAVCAALSANPPVAVVSGQGGAGKTALAVHIGHQLRDRFPDGAFFLNVGGADPLAPPEALSRALRALGVTGEDARGNTDLRERVARYRAELAGKRFLMIVDDAASARQVLPFLPSEAGSALLVTSRSRLVTVPASARVELGVMTAGEAHDLLARMIGAERAEAEPEQITRLVGLCARLPLAVRVAGARLAARPHWTVHRLADRLSDERRRLDELAVDELEVRASLAVSYQGLRPPAQRAFRVLGCLDPPDFTALTVAALLDEDPDDAADLVEEITDARLLDVVAPDGLLTRYRMHDLVRLYAAETAKQEDPAVVARVVSAMLQGVERLAEQLPVATPRLYHPPRPDDGGALLDRADLPRWFAAEEPALVAAVERAAALGLDEVACGLADALVFASFAIRNNFDGWERTHTAAAAAARRAGNVGAEAAMESGMGQLRYAQDRFAESRAHFEAAARLFQAAGDDRGQAVALNGLGTVGRELGEHRVALPQINRARDMLTALGDEAGVAHACYSLGFAHRELGEDEAALAHLGAALGHYRRLGHRRGELIAIRGTGLVHRARGELDEAEGRCAEAHRIAVAVDDRHLLAYTSQALAKVWVRRGEPERAAEPLAGALATMTARRDGQGTALVTRTIGEMHLAAGRYAEAAAQLTEAAGQWGAIGMPLGRARTLRDLGAARCAAGDHDAAHADWAVARQTFDRLGVREKDELTAWREQWGCACPSDHLSSASSAARSTRSTLPPASSARSASDQPRLTSSAKSAG
jgi:DNA-binding SARP family transcriptional activator/tetratricopeptide (TPR) repeat protein